jgi:hypothetical protein
MHFRVKSTLKNNHNHTSKYASDKDHEKINIF